MWGTKRDGMLNHIKSTTCQKQLELLIITIVIAQLRALSMRGQCMIVWILSGQKSLSLYMSQPHVSSAFFVWSPHATLRQGTCTKWNLLSGNVGQETAATTLRALITPRLGLSAKRGRECTITGETRHYNEDMRAGQLSTAVSVMSQRIHSQCLQQFVVQQIRFGW